jgi:hypothetical protein
MTKPDILVTLGLDDTDFRRALEVSGGYSKRKAWQIAKDFERAERAKERAAAEKTAKIQKAYQRMGAAANVAAVAAAAGIGVMTKALAAAAEESNQVKATMDRLDRSGKSFMAELGKDLEPVVRGFADLLDHARKLRAELATKISFTDYETNFQIRRSFLLEKQHAREVQAQDLGRALDRMGGGTRGELAAIVDERRAFMQRLNGLTNGADKEALRARATAHFDGKKRAVEHAAQKPARERARRIADANARVLAVGAQADPLDREKFFASEIANFNRQRESIRSEVYGRGGSVQENEEEIRARTAALRAEMGVRKTAFLERVRQHEEEQARKQDRVRLDMTSQRIEIERLKGNEKLADKLKILAEHERSVAEIRRRADLDEQQRAAMVANADAIRDLRLGDLGRGTGEGPAGLAAGLAGGSTLVRQIVGAGGTGTGGREDPVEKNTADAVGILASIDTTLKNGVPAVAG